MQRFSLTQTTGRWVAAVLILSAGALFAGCKQEPQKSATSARREIREPAGANRQVLVRQQQLEFLQKIRSADPHLAAVDAIIVNDSNELGVVLNGETPLTEVPLLMQMIVAQLAKNFPHDDLKVIAYATSEPPTRVGTARYDARTHHLTFTWSQPPFANPLPDAVEV